MRTMTSAGDGARLGGPSVAPASPAWDLFGALGASEHEKVVVCHDPGVGLRAIIGIHSTVLGPANGGVRMYPYASTEEAFKDVLRLSRAMTYKWSAAGENRGGGKAVIIGDPATDKSEALLRSFGRCVEQLRGEYYVGEDVGITMADMEAIHLETDYVATLPVEAGGVGDIAPWTARGAIHAMQACAEHVWGDADLRGRRVALQGLGACGSEALGQLLELGAEPLVCDLDERRVAAAAARGARVVAPDAIYDADADIFAPFAMGGVINAATVPRLRARVVAGSANNIFERESDAAALEARGITYAPDFIANAGGAIYDAEQFRKGGFNLERVTRAIGRIRPRVHEALALAAREGVTCQAAAHLMAERRLRALAPLRRSWVGA